MGSVVLQRSEAVREGTRQRSLIAQHHGAGLLAHLAAGACISKQLAHLLAQLGGIGHDGGAPRATSWRVMSLKLK